MYFFGIIIIISFIVVVGMINILYIEKGFMNNNVIMYQHNVPITQSST